MLLLPLFLFFLSHAQQALRTIFPVKNGSYRKVWTLFILKWLTNDFSREMNTGSCFNMKHKTTAR